MKYSYYPGCAVQGSAKEFDISAKEVARALEIQLEEIEDWNCCGATAAYAVDHLLSLALPARNIALAEKKGNTITTCCPACYSRLYKTNEALKEDSRLADKVNKALETTGLRYTGNLEVRHIVDILVNDVGIEKIKQKVVRPLKGLKVVPYYGCFLVRPPRKKPIDSPENPVLMDKIISALGATVVDWDMKTKCCGGSLMITNLDVMLNLTYKLLSKAKQLGADCVVTPCPQCNLNLDSRQRDVEAAFGKSINIPVLYITQLMGLAFGIDAKKLALDKNIVSTRKVVDFSKAIVPMR